MSIAERVADIATLSVDDRIRLVQAVWDSIADREASVPVSESQKSELRRRAAELDKDPGIALTWEEIKRRIMSKP